MAESLSIFLTALIKSVIILFGVFLPGAAGSVYFERKISAWIQNRIGPNRVGPFGILQPIVDVVKLIIKEDIIPLVADKRFHALAPVIAVTTAMATFAVMPFGNFVVIGNLRIDLNIASNVNVALLYVLAVGSVSVYAITFAGWSSNNKYSMLGGLRSASQMISYELSMGLSLVGVIMIAGTTSLNGIVEAQANMKWNVFTQPLGFIIFLVASFAETNRSPFDLPEAEPELVGGYNTEYAGMKWGMFFLAEYGHMIAASGMISTLFFGGYDIPFVKQLFPSVFYDGALILGIMLVGFFLTKIAFFAFFFIWVRWSLPRFRYDQLMDLGWKVMMPLALVNIIVTSLVMYALR